MRLNNLLDVSVEGAEFRGEAGPQTIASEHGRVPVHARRRVAGEVSVAAEAGRGRRHESYG